MRIVHGPFYFSGETVFPLDYITLGFIGGLLAGGIPPLAGVRGALGVAALCLGASCACRWAFHDSGIRKASSAFMLAGAGALGIVLVLSFHQWMLPSHHLMRHLPRGRANLVGHLTRPIERLKSSGRARLYIDVERLTIRGVEIPVQGSVRISLSYPPAEPYAVGDHVLVRRVRLRRPIRYRNPGAFNYPEFLRLRSIHATALASPRALERVEPMERFAFQRWLFGFRDRMRAHLREAFPEKTAGLLEAITLGIRENLDGEVRESFRLAGASHILAISGLHVGFITFFFYFVFLAFFRRLPPDVFPARPIVLTPMKAASLAVIPIVILFALLTGARVSTIRAAIMAVVYLLTRILERPGGAMHSVLLAAIIILAIEPGFVWDTGFQLSFVAVASIILAARHLPRPHTPFRLGDWSWWRARLLQFAGIQVVVSLAMAPLTAFHFQQIQLAGLVTNFFLIPVASVVVPLSFLLSAFAASASAMGMGWFGKAVTLAEWLPGLLAAGMMAVTRLAASVPAGTLDVPKPGAFPIAMFLASLTVALGVRRAAIRQAGWVAVALSMAIIVWPLALASAKSTGRTTLIFPDAGRKDVFFIRLPDGRGFAVDANRPARGGFDIWRRVLAPLLRNQGERNWEALILLARSGGGSALKEMRTGMRLRRVMAVDPSGNFRLEYPATGRAGPLSPNRDAPGAVLWQTESQGARLSLHKLTGRNFAFRLVHGKARWLMIAGNGRGLTADDLPQGKFDLVRLLEAMLRNEGVLRWLEENPPFAVISSPGRADRLPYDEWRRIRARQRALGTYRPRWAGMVRVSTGGGALGQGGRIERYAASRSWPRSSLGRWVRYYSGAERRRAGFFRSRRSSKKSSWERR